MISQSAIRGGGAFGSSRPQQQRKANESLRSKDNETEPVQPRLGTARTSFDYTTYIRRLYHIFYCVIRFKEKTTLKKINYILYIMIEIDVLIHSSFCLNDQHPFTDLALLARSR